MSRRRGLFLFFSKKEWRLDGFDRLEIWEMPGHRSMGDTHVDMELKRSAIYFVYLVQGDNLAVKLSQATENCVLMKSRTKKVADFCGVHCDMNDKIHTMKMSKTWNKYSVTYPVKE
ncbi:MAG: hypothetical protein WCH04_22255 [Gammaproteobacteria bacterium]